MAQEKMEKLKGKDLELFYHILWCYECNIKRDKRYGKAFPLSKDAEGIKKEKCNLLFGIDKFVVKSTPNVVLENKVVLENVEGEIDELSRNTIRVMGGRLLYAIQRMRNAFAHAHITKVGDEYKMYDYDPDAKDKDDKDIIIKMYGRINEECVETLVKALEDVDIIEKLMNVKSVKQKQKAKKEKGKKKQTAAKQMTILNDK